MESENVKQYSPPDKGSILEYINSSSDIVNIVNDMLGLNIYYMNEKGQVRTVVTRVSKPLFTREYVMQLAQDLHIFLNFTVQVSKFDQAKINMKMKNYLLALLKHLNTHGDDNYISNDTWQKILAIHQDYYILDDKNRTKLSGWQRFGFNWDINKPVDFGMMYFVKDFTEEVDQVIDFSKVIATFSAIIEASFNKSYSSANNDFGMLLRTLGEMRTESTVLKEKEKEKKPFLGFAKKEEKKMEEWQ